MLTDARALAQTDRVLVGMLAIGVALWPRRVTDKK
ncbi:MAG: hypothetical protein H6Q71_2921 [Firmicutes bacterium]|nr:hypothetical protein [Bacillota bacterium]